MGFGVEVEVAWMVVIGAVMELVAGFESEAEKAVVVVSDWERQEAPVVVGLV